MILSTNSKIIGDEEELKNDSFYDNPLISSESESDDMSSESEKGANFNKSGKKTLK